MPGVQNYSTIVNALTQFSTNHLSLRRFKTSFFEQFNNFSTTDNSFPILYAVPQDISFNEYIDVITFRVYCVDILQKDRSNESTVLNDTLLVLRDLTNWFRLDRTNDLNILNDPRAIPVNNFLVDFTVGWYVDIQIEASTITSDCAIPFSDNFQLTGITCDINIVTPYLTCDTLAACSTFISLVDRVIVLEGLTGATMTTLPVTYIELTDLINNSLLTPQRNYLITDYATTYDQPDYDAFGIPKAVVATVTTADEPLIVQAVDVDRISNVAVSSVYPNDTIRYDWTFNQTEFMLAPAKGRITERVTYEDNNRTNYDHRYVVFKRYDDGAGNYIIINDNGQAFNDILPTFKRDCFNNYIGNYYNSFFTLSPFILSNNVFGDNTNDIITGDDFYNNTISYIIKTGFSRTRFGNNCYSNVINAGRDNNIGDNFYNNYINLNFADNQIQNDFHNNTLNGKFESNIIASNFYDNITEEFIRNHIGFNFRTRNPIGNSFISNRIGNDWNQNVIGINFINNFIGDNFNNNTIGDDFRSMDVGNNFINQTIGNNVNTYTVIEGLTTAFVKNTNGWLEPSLLLSEDISGTTLTVNGALSATTISATTYYGDGSNLTGINTTDTYVTGFTLSSNTLTISQNEGQPDLSVDLSNISLSGYQLTSNLVTSWSTPVTDVHYPSEALVYNTLVNEYVPYINAIADVDLGTYELYAQQLHARATIYTGSRTIADGNIHFNNLNNNYFTSLLSAGINQTQSYTLHLPINLPNLGLGPYGQSLILESNNQLGWSILPVGSVTYVSALNITSTGTSITSSVVSATTTPVISLDIPFASSGSSGQLSSADWIIFNSKQGAITTGNLTNSGPDGITITGGTGAVIGTGTTISQQKADATHNGYLSSTDWTTFNSKGNGDMLKSVYDVDNTGVVDNAEAILVIGRNSTGVPLYQGTIVYISGSTGNRPNFVKARADIEATSAGTFGVIQNDIANNANGNCLVIGYLDTLDTRTVASHPFTTDTLVDGDTIYLSPTIAGYVTNVKPSAPNHLVYVGKVVRTSATNGTIVYRIQNGYELEELHNVAISAVTNNDGLFYETSTSLWKNKLVSEVITITSTGTTGAATFVGDVLNIPQYAGVGTSLGRVLFVATTGNDSTAVIGNLAKPYLTLEGAVSAATTGDTIEVYPGSYTATTISTNGISKDGVDFYFHKGATVTKTSTGDLFRVIGYTIGSNVYGYGTFIRPSGAGGIYIAVNTGNPLPLSLNCVFEFDKCSSTSTTGIILGFVGAGYTFKIRGLSTLTSTGGICIGLYQTSSALIDVPFIKSTANIAVYLNGNNTNSQPIVINSAQVQSTTTYGVSGTGGVFNIHNCYGVTYGYNVAGSTGNIHVINGYTTGINMGNYSDVYLNGLAGVINCAEANSRLFGGAVQDGLTVSAGYVNTNIGRTTSVPIITVSGGRVDIMNMQYSGNQYKIIQSGGILNLNGTINAPAWYQTSTISAGRLNLNCDITIGEQPEWIQMTASGATVNLNNARITMNGTNRVNKNAFIRYQAGTIISNGASIKFADTNCQAFVVEGANRNIKVLSGGFNTNLPTNILSAKKQKLKYTVTAVATTSITLNDGTGGNEIFTETGTTTYNTTAKLAQRMVALINASATLDITASQDTAGTDVYFYAESDVAGTAFTIPATTNLTSLWVVENSYALTNVTGGNIIQDIDVE